MLKLFVLFGSVFFSAMILLSLLPVEESSWHCTSVDLEDVIDVDAAEEVGLCCPHGRDVGMDAWAGGFDNPLFSKP